MSRVSLMWIFRFPRISFFTMISTKPTVELGAPANLYLVQLNLHDFTLLRINRGRLAPPVDFLTVFSYSLFLQSSLTVFQKLLSYKYLLVRVSVYMAAHLQGFKFLPCFLTVESTIHTVEPVVNPSVPIYLCRLI